MNQIIYLHNHGTEDEVYGSRLYLYCTQLMNEGKVEQSFPNQIYVLSVDWPLDFVTDYISKMEFDELMWASHLPAHFHTNFQNKFIQYSILLTITNQIRLTSTCEHWLP